LCIGQDIIATYTWRYKDKSWQKCLTDSIANYAILGGQCECMHCNRWSRHTCTCRSTPPLPDFAVTSKYPR